MKDKQALVHRGLGVVSYRDTFAAMKAFTAGRGLAQADELWTLQHHPVFTLGRAGKREHILAAGDIAVIESDRGGQVTYHGPGQVLVYTLLDVRRMGIGPRELVRRLEQAVIDYLASVAICGERLTGAPGVYVAGEKIAALGLRIRQRYSYHGIALNVAMDLEPYERINPCGYAGLKATELRAHGGPDSIAIATAGLLQSLCGTLYPGEQLDVRHTDSLDAVESVNMSETVLI